MAGVSRPRHRSATTRAMTTRARTALAATVAVLALVAALSAVEKTSLHPIRAPPPDQHRRREMPSRRSLLSFDPRTVGPREPWSFSSGEVMPLVANFGVGEGINAQKHSLMSFLHLASAAGRDLVILPFRSRHYRDPATGELAWIRMEDYFDNTGEYRWTTANPETTPPDSYVGRVMANGNDWRKNDCLFGSSFFNIYDDEGRMVQHNVRNYTDTDELVGRIRDAEPDYACIFLRASAPYMTALEPSRLVVGMAELGLNRLRPKLRDPDKPVALSAVHLRRGDKCSSKDVIRPVSCGPPENLPFLSLCRRLWDDGSGLYVATNERNEDYLAVLRANGCFLADDLWYDFDAVAEDNNRKGKVNSDGWASVHGGALAFAVETQIIFNAVDLFTVGRQSSLLVDMQHWRREKRLSRVMIYEEDGTFATASW